MIQQRTAVRICFWILAVCSHQTRLAAQGEPDYPITKKLFAARDANADKQLTSDEFASAVPATQKPAAKREFKLLDRDADGTLGFDEFRNTSRIIPTQERGFVSDPAQKWVIADLKRYDEKAAQWDSDGNGDLSAAELAASSFFLVFKHPFRTRQGAKQFLTATPTGPWMDRDKNQQMTRDEVQFALEVSYGIRRWQGELLRSKNGLIYNWRLFKHVDENHNDSAGRFEFINRADAGDKQTAEKKFEAADTDHSLALSFAEWCAIESQQLDPFAVFLERDADLDGRVSKAELLAGTPKWQQPVAKHIFPGFDTDEDGTLSLEEFRCTPLVDQVYDWHLPLTDTDGDGKLSRDEFVYEADQKIPIHGGLLSVYFDQYDLDDDELLSHDELIFNTKQPNDKQKK